MNELSLMDTPAELLDVSDALAIISDWKEFKNPDFDAIKSQSPFR